MQRFQCNAVCRGAAYGRSAAYHQVADCGGDIRGALLGAFLMSFLANGCTLTGVPNYVQEILIGAIIVAAVALDRWRHRHGVAGSGMLAA